MSRSLGTWLRGLLSGPREQLTVPAAELTEAPPMAAPAQEVTTEFPLIVVPAQVSAGDDEARLVFADALEQEGLTAERQWLKQEALLFTQAAAEGEQTRATLRELKVSGDFKASIARTFIERCDVDDCASNWSSLAPRTQPQVRKCATCTAEVHFASTLERAQLLARQGCKIAVSPDLERTDEDLDRISWSLFASRFPRWSDAAETCVPCLRTLPPLELPVHPLFARWHQELMASPVEAALAVLRSSPSDWEPTADDCFVHGRVAFLEEHTWPSCSRCSKPLEMCLQLSPSVMANWVPGDRGLVVMFCFHCGVSHGHEPGVSYVRSVRPLHRVTCKQVGSASSGWDEHSVQVRPAEPRRRIPDSMWLRYRSEVTEATAGSQLFGFNDGEGELPVNGEQREALSDELDGWIEAFGDGSNFLGGVAHWDQGDQTPSCPHGTMLHLLDYNGDQFLDGALHVFECRQRKCAAFRCVAEF